MDPAPTDAAAEVRRQREERWLGGVVAATLVLNLLDAVLTTVWVLTGAAREANPLLADLAHHRPVAFMAVKLALVSLGSWLLWRRRDRPVAVVGIFAVFVAYYALLLHHLRGMELGLVARVAGWLAGWPGR